MTESITATVPLTDYRVIVVGTDGSALAEPTVARAAWLAAHERADLVIVSAYAELSRRQEARNPATLGGDARVGQVPGREAAGRALTSAVQIAAGYGATVAAALLIDGDPAEALLEAAEQRGAGLIVLGASAQVSIAERLLGTVPAEVGRKARCDVLIVRPPAGVGDGDLVVPESEG